MDRSPFVLWHMLCIQMVMNATHFVIPMTMSQLVYFPGVETKVENFWYQPDNVLCWPKDLEVSCCLIMCIILPQ